MTVRKQQTDELLGLDKFAVDEDTPHVVIDKEKCAKCTEKACLVVCPAKLYKEGPDGQIQFDYAGCLECGTCRVMCQQKALDWHYPQGTFGVSFRFG